MARFASVFRKYARLLFKVLGRLRLTRLLSDRQYMTIYYWLKFGEKIDLSDPKGFNEKLQWLKLHDRKPEYTRMVDKLLVKDYVAEQIGSGGIIPTLGVWDSFDQIDFDSLPDRFVLKCTHDSGGIVICKDKASFDREAARKKLNRSMARNYYYGSREWPYKNVEKKILAEAYLSDGQNADLPDYKFHCFNGEPKVVLVCRDRYSLMTEDFFTPDWQHLDMKRPNHPIAKTPIPAPSRLEEMCRLARQLSKDVPFLRVDFYEVNGVVYFGELTFFPASGFGIFEPPQWDRTLGDWLTLPEPTE